MSNNKIVIPQNFQVTESEGSQNFDDRGGGGGGNRRGAASRELYTVLNQITRKLNAADGQTAVATANASDLATAVALANSLKTALNALIAALQK